MKLKKLLLGAVISLTVFSCNQDDLHENVEKTVETKTEISVNETQENHGEKMILGKQKENPYSLSNMQKAVSIIATTKKANLLKQTVLKPTHQYVVFIPENQQHLETLSTMVDSQKYVTRSYPMDYEIEQYGEDYVDKRAKSDELPVLYASIPVTDKLPNVPYEKLEDLYLTDNEQDKIILRNGQTNDIIMNNYTDRVFLGSYYRHPVKTLFNAMGSGESTGYDLKKRLKNENYSKRTQIEELFNAYGY